MQVYLYLNEHWHADVWVNGGEVPIGLASDYKSDKRSGVLTIDENKILNSDVPLEVMAPVVSFGPGVIGCSQSGNVEVIIDGGGRVVRRREIPAAYDVDYYYDDGLILSFSRTNSKALAKRFEKKNCCVSISNIYDLKFIIDEQIGCESTAKFCEYTKGHNRNHFLKSHEDSWQAEFRLFWPVREHKKVVIPPGYARHVFKI